MNEEITKLMEEKIEELYNFFMEKPFQILDIFNDFFGEERVDMQGYWTLDGFKNWIKTTPLYIYLHNNKDILSESDWNEYNPHAINDLPIEIAKKVVDVLTDDRVKGLIGVEFNHIFILVHFPHVRITNEHNRFVDINNLWAKLSISYNGTLIGGFKLNRSEYSLLHISSGYLHSHISSIPIHNFMEFQNPCLGSGPIINTISTLNREYDRDMWNLFCLELSKYVTVESLDGVPYRRLEAIGSNNRITRDNTFETILRLSSLEEPLTADKLKEFTRYFINLKKLKFNYINGSYSIGMSFIEYIVLISNAFIEWYNNQFNKNELISTFEDLKIKNILKECIINNGKIYDDFTLNSINTYTRYIGKKVCVFKGKEITIDITDLDSINNENKNIILNPQIALYILTIILKVLNYRYGRTKAIHRDNQIDTEVRYL